MLTRKTLATASLLLAAACSAPPSLSSQIDAAEAIRLRDASVKAGYITSHTCTGNEAMVTPHFWNGIDAKAKEGVVLSLARICDVEQSGDRMTVKDATSGKTLASYSGGYSVKFY